MSIFPNFLRSLLLTVLFSFATPILVIGSGLVSLILVSYIPGLEVISHDLSRQILGFLAIFGSGFPVKGALVIAFTCTFVGSIFEIYAFYHYQNLHNS